MLKVWGRRSAFNVQKVLWAIGELGIEHEQIDAGGAFGGLDTPEFRAMNPNSAIPVVVDEGPPIWESHTTIRYLAATYGRGSLWPEDPTERSLADRWMDWTLANLGPSFMQLFWALYRTPEAQRNPGLIDRSLSQSGRLYGLLDRHLAKVDFVAGPRLTMGDIPAGTTLYRYFELEIERPDLPHLSAWYERLCERPAFREHIMRPFDELKGRLAF